ncbi:MAG TPA: NADH-ubiquinone oxidoreductase-F iron-sulfur binding region domain-containing protein, partial [Armatimonadota bacterium]|nr:NADH-ubiquinone oxidoreductase-F iron-sulfur binding region domain-containing protein [Armatimonadota bacterium]
MERNERVDPRRILDYIESGGYTSLVEVLAERNPEWVVSEVKASGLRGRGGAGFPTGIKWEMLAKQPSDKGKFIVCNADEGDPGAYMDRSILEGNPHSIIEGMIIGAFATGATDGIIYVCCEFPLAIKHIGMALEQAYELGLLGENILGAGFSFNMTMVKGAGAFVCGEETAMIHSIEGYTGEPRQRPPFPIQKGINGKPTAINNVETWANIPIIIRDGAKAYASIGTPNNSGTKIFSLVGKVKHTGLVEMPMGTTIGEIVYNVGGGAVGNSKIKAVQTGGPSGGCIPASSFDLPVDYDTLAKFGSIMGSGGMIVMDEDTCMVDVAKYFMNFLKNESCGKCFTCRKGTQRMYELLEDITLGAGTPESIALLEELAYVVKDTTMCGLGQSASNSVLSSLKHFRNEYEQHVVEGKCPSYVCKDLVGVPCQTACPVGTEIWRYIAQIEHKNYVDAYKTIRESNPFPSVCARVCNHPCEDRCKSGTSGGQPINIRALTRFVTDNVDPGVYKPVIEPQFGDKHPQVAVVGGGPAGLTAAHYLSLKGCKVTIFEQESELGGMLLSVIPEYKLPGEVLKSEIASLLNDNITLKYGTVLGRDITVDGLLKDNFDAVFLSFGAHNSSGLQSDIKDIQGVYPLLDYVKSVNLRGENLAIGKVGIIGGSVSAIDAARTAIRSAKAESVTVFYQGTREDMLAAKDEIDAAIEEGVSIETLVSVEEILSQDGKLAGARIVKSRLGDFDSDGRRRLKPIAG